MIIEHKPNKGLLVVLPYQIYNFVKMTGVPENELRNLKLQIDIPLHSNYAECIKFNFGLSIIRLGCYHKDSLVCLYRSPDLSLARDAILILFLHELGHHNGCEKEVDADKYAYQYIDRIYPLGQVEIRPFKKLVETLRPLKRLPVWH